MTQPNLFFAPRCVETIKRQTRPRRTGVVGRRLVGWTPPRSAICGVECVSRWRNLDMWCQPLSMHYCQPLAAGHSLPLATTLSLDSDVVVQPLATAFRDRDRTFPGALDCTGQCWRLRFGSSLSSNGGRVRRTRNRERDRAGVRRQEQEPVSVVSHVQRLHEHLVCCGAMGPNGWLFL